MKRKFNQHFFFFFLLFSVALTSQAQTTEIKETTSKPSNMKTYLIEREVPGAGSFTPEQLKEVSQGSNKILKEMGPHIEWIHSYVTGNKIFCIYKAENEDLIREHGKKGGFPVNNITRIDTKISPATAQ